MAIYPIEYLRKNDVQRSIDGLILTKCSYNPNFNRNWHDHENPSLSLNLKGGSTDQRKNKEADIKAGDLILHHSGELHRNKFYTENSRQFCIEIEQKWFAKFDIKEQFITNSFIIEDSNIKTKIAALVKEFSDPGTRRDISVESLLLDCITDLNSFKISNHYPGWMDRLKELLNDEYYVEWSLTNLAKRIGVHPVTISKYFSRYFKTTIGDYTRKIKINRSFSCLSNKSVALSDIAIKFGFTDHAHYTKTFKKYTRLTPSEYRRFVFG